MKIYNKLVRDKIPEIIGEDEKKKERGGFEIGVVLEKVWE
jgi:predicted house-cleaning noncanonical NTP pyrophosphatase (MazG superfamily)